MTINHCPLRFSKSSPSDTANHDAQKKSAISAEDFADALVNELEKPAHRKAQATIAY